MSYTCLLFDLDGTLTDSGPGIIHSAAYALEKMGYPVGDPALLRRFVGPPLNETFHTCYGVPLEEMVETIRQYRVRYNELGGIFENSVYPGMEGCLGDLRAAGKTLLVATSKPLPMARRVLDHFGLTPYFDGVFGGTMDESGGGCYKPRIVGQAVASCGEVPLSQILMVGDREHDVFGAHENGIACAGVLWGYGSREEFAAAGAEYIVEDYEELKKVAL